MKSFLSEPSEASMSSLARLYLDKRGELLRFFTARTGSQSEAEDLVQELYFKVQRAREEEVSNPLPYLYRLGLNLLIDMRRSGQRSRKRDSDYVLANADLREGVLASLAPSAEDAAEWRQRLALLARAVEALPPQRQRVFRLHKLDGLSHAAVAEALGISRSAVEKHMAAALKSLAAAMK
jgi:RNA polymerase sigma factor (sigma-70 family)